MTTDDLRALIDAADNYDGEPWGNDDDIQTPWMSLRPDTVAALARIALAAMAWHAESSEGHDALDDALRDAGLI